MKRLFLFIICLFVLFLTGCKRDTIIELKRSNFNKHFIINYEVEQTDNNYRFIVTVDPRFELEFEMLRADINFTISYQKLFENQETKHTQEKMISFEAQNNERIENEYIFKFNESINNFELTSYSVVEIEGEIKTQEYPRYLHKGFVENKIKNRLNYIKMNSELKEFDEKFNSNYFNISTNTSSRLINKDCKGEYSSEYSLLKIRVDPFYSEIASKAENAVVKNENGTLYQYAIDKNLKGIPFVEKSILEDTEDIPDQFSLESFLELSEANVDFKFDYRNIKINIKEDFYELTGYYRHIMSKEDYEIFLNQMKDIGIENNIVDEAIFKMIISVKEDEIKYEISLDIFLSEKFYAISSKYVINIDFNEFDELDLSDYMYYYPVATNINEVSELTNVLNDVVAYENPNPHYYLAELDPGQYIFNDYANDIELIIYDENKNELKNVFIFSDELGIKEHNYTFSVHEKGKYYLKVTNKNNILLEDYKFKLIKLDYQDSFDFVNPINVTEGELNFSIEGEYDIVPINYYSDKQGVIVFENQVSNNAIFYRIEDYNLNINNPNPIYEVNKGENIIYLLGEKNAYSYFVTFYEIDVNKCPSTPTPILMSEWTDYIITGRETPYSNFSINIPKGIINLEIEYLLGSNIDISIINSLNVKYIELFYMDSYSYKYIFDEDEYTIQISSSYAAIVRVRLTYEKLEDKIETIELEIKKDKYGTPPSFSTYRGEYYYVDGDFDYGFKFELTEKSNVRISIDNYGYYYNLYDDDLNLLIFKSLSGPFFYDVFSLNPGTYTVKVLSDTPNYRSIGVRYYDLNIGIWDMQINDEHPYGHGTKELILGNNYVHIDYQFDKDVFMFTLTEPGIFSYESIRDKEYYLYIFNNDFSKCLITYYTPNYEEFYLETGVYYFVFSSSVFNTHSSNAIIFNMNKK